MREIKHNNHRLFQGDCLDVMDKLILEGVKVDAIICDPTFGTTNRKNDIVLDYNEMWKRLLLLRKDKATPIILMANGINYVDLVQSNRKMFKYSWIWDKVIPTGMLNAKRMPMNGFDHIAVFYEKQCIYNPIMGKGKPEHGRGNIKNKTFDNDKNNYNAYKICTDNKGRTEKHPNRIITIQKDHASVVVHSQQKPVELGEYLIKTYTNEGDTILDFMMGSGFIPLACNNLNRNNIGIDIGVCEKEKYTQYYNKPWNEVVKMRMIEK